MFSRSSGSVFWESLFTRQLLVQCCMQHLTPLNLAQDVRLADVRVHADRPWCWLSWRMLITARRTCDPEALDAAPLRRCGQLASSANSASSANAGVLWQRGCFLLCPRVVFTHSPRFRLGEKARKQKLTHQARGNMGQMGHNGNQHNPPGNRRPHTKFQQVTPCLPNRGAP